MPTSDPALVVPLQTRFRKRARLINSLIAHLKADHTDYWANVNAAVQAAEGTDVITDNNSTTHPCTVDNMVSMKAIEDAFIAAYDVAGRDTLIAKFAVTELGT